MTDDHAAALIVARYTVEDPADFCRRLQALDRAYDTDPRSPLHHDSGRCPIHGRPR